MENSQIETLRGFNRLISARIGALEDKYLARPRPLGASRVLWEIGTGPIDIRALRSHLGLDSGYLSRLVRSLEKEGLVLVEPSKHDTRVRSISLTKEGRRERDILDRQSDDLAAALLDPLTESQRLKMIEAATVMERLVTIGLVEIRVENPKSAEAEYCIGEYFAELGKRFETGFDPAASISADAKELTEPAGLLLLAWLRGDLVGCGALKFPPSQPAEIKRMWVSPSARGLGVGRRILMALENEARKREVDVVRLETNQALEEAIKLYRSAGYREVPAFNDEPFAHHWFEKNFHTDHS